MTQTTGGIVRKLWQYCNVLRDDGLSYPDYVEQLTYLLFLKMADERPGELVPAGHGWRSFASLDTQALREQYETVLSELGDQSGTLGLIFGGARNKISDPAKLRYLVVELVGQTEWTGLSADVKGDAYEGLLEKNARDTKSGAGQYFTPRPLVEAIVECVDPAPGEVICDPACGTGGFLLAAQDRVGRAAGDSPAAAKHLRTRALRGVELVQEVARLAAMNLFLHGIAGDTADDVPILCDDSLREQPAARVDVVLSNPPFGVKGSVTYAATAAMRDGSLDERTVVRPDFWARTANKQLNFLQHISTLLSPRVERQWLCQTTCSSSRAPQQPSGVGCSNAPTCTLCSDCRPGSSMRRVCSRTSCSSTPSLAPTPTVCCGCTTFAPRIDTPSRRGRLRGLILTSSWPSIA